ncbi:hypothetical protein GmHk_04G010187 [Glycine max]|uniref:DUF4283 domain-containing protein n=1 Tax=Glycine soja TaxID=3848 RepID=A0A445KZJ1_GLYSO|nr:hypothetical protein GmHk_04G010187 [Glycine max]RZC16146.1 hypothetical protein D0Y65_009430 [Glycine soja]
MSAQDFSPTTNNMGATSLRKKPSDDSNDDDSSSTTRTSFRDRVMDRLPKLWKFSAGYDLMDISNGFYMAKFDIEPDRAHVMEDGPWMLFNHYLTVLRRSPEFASPTAKIDRTLVWI